MKLHLDSNIVEGTPEELAKYKELSHKTKREVDEEGFDARNYSILSVEAQAPSIDIQVGDRVKVLRSNFGAEGEATVTKVLENGNVKLAGKNWEGRYATDWHNRIPNLEKIEEEAPMGYTFWYIDRGQRRKHNVLKATLDGNFEDSTGRRYTKGIRYTNDAVSGLIKPITNEYAREEFEEAKEYKNLLKYYPTADEFTTSY